METVRPASLLGVWLLGWLCSATAQAEPVRLDEALARLADQGHAVLYSDDVVAPDAVIDLADVTIPALRNALSSLGLALDRISDHWIIVAAGPSPDTNEVHERLPEADPVTPVENVIVTGTRHRLAGRNVTGSLTSLTADDLASVPSLGGDAMRATAALPGMSSVGISAKPFIRGGVQDELLVRLDGIELLDAYHLADFQSVFSIVDDRSVEAVDVYTGGFPARYGNRMSGVMDIVTGRADSEPRTELGISLFSLLVNRHGSTNDGNTRYLFSARRGNLDQAIDLVDSSLGTPRYYDAYTRIDQRLSESSRLSAGALISKDDVSLQEDETTARSAIDNRYVWSRLELDHGDGFTSSSSLAYTWSRRRKGQGDLDDDSGAGGFLVYRQALWKLGARTDLSLHRNDALLEFGAQAEYGEAHYDSVGVIDRGLVGHALGGPTVTAYDVHTDPAGWSGGLYWAAELPITRRWLLQPGIRWDFQDFARKRAHQLSPRLGVRFRPAEVVSLRLDVGRFHQPQSLHELPAGDGESRFFPSQRSDHYIAALEWLVSSRWEMEVGVYEKRYGRTSPRYENVFNPFVLVPELEPDRMRLDPERARARGADLVLAFHPTERVSGALIYGYMDAEDRLDGQWVPRRWSQRHTARATAAWRGPRLTAALTLTWHSGWRGADLPESVPEDALLTTGEVLNSVELDDYFSLDASLRRTWQAGRTRITATANITNLTDRRNLAGYEYDGEEEDDLILFERQEEHLLPLIPSVGILITF